MISKLKFEFTSLIVPPLDLIYFGSLLCLDSQGVLSSDKTPELKTSSCYPSPGMPQDIKITQHLTLVQTLEIQPGPWRSK